MTFPTWSVGEVLTAADMNAIGQYITYPRNLLYNGAMQVAQRGTSTASITTSGYYTADRWNLLISSLGTWTQTVENDAPTGSGFRKSLKMLCTTADASPAAGDYAIIQQILEGQDLQSIRKGTSSAQQLTMSFWVKSNRTGTYVCQLNDDDNSRSVSATYTVSASGTWEYKTVTFPADTTGALDNDNAASLTVRWWLGAGSTFTSGTLNTTWQSTVSGNIAVGQVNVAGTVNNYWQVTGVQLNVGSVAAPFEFKSFGQELRECQRYYEKGESAIHFQIIINATYVGWTERLVYYKQRKRSTGTVSVTVTGSNNAAAGNGTIQDYNVDGFAHRQDVANAGFPYCSYSLVYTANSEL